MVRTFGERDCHSEGVDLMGLNEPSILRTNVDRPHAALPICRSRIADTAKILRPHVRETPVIDIEASDFGIEAPGVKLSLKLEFLQHSGSFKVRGAFANLITRGVPAAGVVAASGGNHGAAVAFAAQRLGVPAKIFVPSVSTAAKVELIRSYGASLEIAGRSYSEALLASETWQQAHGALSIHAFDQAETLIGQGTLGPEIERQVPNMDTLIIAVGGGGLIAGIASWFEGPVRIVGAEPEASPTLTRALQAGRPVDAEVGGIAADSLAPRRIGELVFPIVSKRVAGVVLVSDEEIKAAQIALWRTARIVAEPGGATAFAALLSGRYRPSPGERVCVIVCGANTTAVDFDR
jgi:threonine dehydratase